MILVALEEEDKEILVGNEKILKAPDRLFLSVEILIKILERKYSKNAHNFGMVLERRREGESRETLLMMTKIESKIQNPPCLFMMDDWDRNFRSKSLQNDMIWLWLERGRRGESRETLLMTKTKSKFKTRQVLGGIKIIFGARKPSK